MSRAEHLAWCKERALEYVDAGDLRNAFASLMSDLSKHEATSRDTTGIATLGTMLMMGGQLDTAAQMRAFIEGVN